jgi:hypothetical protein
MGVRGAVHLAHQRRLSQELKLKSRALLLSYRPIKLTGVASGPG